MEAIFVFNQILDLIQRRDEEGREWKRRGAATKILRVIAILH
jgi:hypothetical protein